MTKLEHVYCNKKRTNLLVDQTDNFVNFLINSKKTFVKTKNLKELLNSKSFVHLHLHTEYSLLDGCTRIEKVVKVAKEMGMPAIAITDHGNMYGAIRFYDACKKVGIKPIIGCEMYVADDLLNKNGKQKLDHLILLAKNEEGYLNLCKLNSIAFRDGFYYKPRIDYKTLKQHSGGLVCTSACLAGTVPQLILKRQLDDAEKQVLWFKEVFGDDFYLEIQMHRPDNSQELNEEYRAYIEEQTLVNNQLKEYAKKYNIKLVATNDVHYIYKEDAELQDILMCISMQKTLDDTDRLKMSGSEYYFKSRQDMLKALPDDEQAIDNSIEIALKCNFDFKQAKTQNLDKNMYHFPNYQPPTGQTCDQYIRDLVEKGIVERYGKETKEIRDRVESELYVINKLGFSQYFLTVRDYIKAAHNMGVPVGQGRGSGAGSIIAYTINITDIDPIKYDLLFERFLHMERVTAPDFDIDFSDDGRQKVIDYTKQKYGEDKVVNIVTFGTLAAKMAIKDVGRVLRIPYSETDKVTKIIPTDADAAKHHELLKKCFGLGSNKDNAIPELVEIYNNNPDIKKVVDIASKLEGMPRQTGTHACGVLIGFDTLENYIPIGRNGDILTTQYEAADIERLGHLKMDFLGLCNLNDIKTCKELVKQNHNIDLDFNKIGYEDPKVYELLSSGNTTAVFQLESGGFQKFMKELKPTHLEDIIAGVALYRPGPMDIIPRFVHNKHNPLDTTYAHPLLENILNVTYGCIVYQEQVQRILQVLAGYTLGQADMVRRMMGKKKVDEMKAEKQIWLYGKPAEDGKTAIDGIIKRGIKIEVGEQIWSEMENFAKYAFNKSHAACYAYIAYQTAYLKNYYKGEFMTAVINNRINKADEMSHYVSYSRSEGIEVLPPDINISQTKFTINNNKMRFGLCAIKGIGEGICDGIVEERQKNGDYKSLENFLSRTVDLQINKRVIEGMIYSGAFDCFGVRRSQMIAVYENALAQAIKEKQSKAAGQFSLFSTLLNNQESIIINYPNIQEYDLKTKLKHEKEALGIYISGHPLEEHMELTKTFTFDSSMVKENQTEDIVSEDDGEDQVGASNGLKDFGLEDGSKVVCGGIINKVNRKITKDNKTMAILDVEDLYGTFSVMIYARLFEQVKSKLAEDKIIVVNGRLSIREGFTPTIIAENINFVGEESEQYNTQAYKKERLVFGETNNLSKHILYLQFNIQNDRVLNAVNNILISYNGNTQVRAVWDKKAYPLNVLVEPTDALISELNNMLGSNNVKLV